MKPGFILTIFLSLFSFSSCSGDKTEKQPLKQSSSEQVEKKPSAPAPNPPNSQVLQPDLHLSGTQTTHVSGSMPATKHVSGR